ncbi:hypothetical protein ASPWEDRAFT_598870 [Aspergillus wentii DTO 134E9]|uniref:Uncharacterized protein n=1 Tax=Aspergillus wentii DTO 134E9 TaxID=1073089 RepID=A0A1L9RDJ4_ASPWE|nr:uncharacterized protein ASPWEDRAFT_598870 [Aspergillus wentii DTO 134E9]OJJ32958.1 hypothetical protein ASPWEDRAFT_598870 [Aspergillus wentii DTO 134E9]
MLHGAPRLVPCRSCRHPKTNWPDFRGCHPFFLSSLLPYFFTLLLSLSLSFQFHKTPEKKKYKICPSLGCEKPPFEFRRSPFVSLVWSRSFAWGPHQVRLHRLLHLLSCSSLLSYIYLSLAR